MQGQPSRATRRRRACRARGRGESLSRSEVGSDAAAAVTCAAMCCQSLRQAGATVQRRRRRAGRKQRRHAGCTCTRNSSRHSSPSNSARLPHPGFPPPGRDPCPRAHRPGTGHPSARPSSSRDDTPETRWRRGPGPGHRARCETPARTACASRPARTRCYWQRGSRRSGHAAEANKGSRHHSIAKLNRLC